MAVTTCDRCSDLIDLDRVEAYTEDGNDCFCESCMDIYLEEQEDEEAEHRAEYIRNTGYPFKDRA